MSYTAEWHAAPEGNVKQNVMHIPLPHKAFLSFSSAESDTAATVAAAFEGSDIACFYAPRDITTGRNYARDIVSAITGCEAFVLLLSPSAVSSVHVRRELTLAVEQNKLLLPFALNGLQYPSDIRENSDWVYWLSAVQVSTYGGAQQVLEVVAAALGESADAGGSSLRTDEVPLPADAMEPISDEAFAAALGSSVSKRISAELKERVSQHPDARRALCTMRDHGLGKEIDANPSHAERLWALLQAGS